MKKLSKALIRKIFEQIRNNPRFYNYLLQLMVEYGKKEEYLTYHFRPRGVGSDVDDKIPTLTPMADTAVLVQGPVLKSDDFTKETLALYRKRYPEAKIILSIWDDEDEVFLKEEERLGTVIVRNAKPPAGVGFINLNFQLVNTLGGIKKAQELGCSYVLKTRTDNRIYQSGFLEFLHALLDEFPVNCENQVNRIIGININTHKYGIGISDLFQFGHIDDMLKMWDVPLSTNAISREEYVEKFEPSSTAKTRFDFEFSECYILKRFMENLGVKIEPTLESYYRALKDQFIIIDASMINLFFCKYFGDEYKGWKNYKKMISHSAFTFMDWLTLYKSSDLNLNEKVVDVSYDFWKTHTIEDL